jgi:hypothetical protein
VILSGALNILIGGAAGIKVHGVVFIHRPGIFIVLNDENKSYDTQTEIWRVPVVFTEN